jgi:hypothetical protein
MKELPKKTRRFFDENRRFFEIIFLGFAYQGKKDIVFRFIIEYSSLMDFGPPM